MQAKLIETTHPRHSETLAEILLQGGIIGAIWGYHLYFLACNAFNKKTVEKMNLIKGRDKDQVFASPGAAEEAEEFADFKKSKALNYAARRMGMSPYDYLEFLYHKFPLAVELYANKSAPSSVTFVTENGKTIWIAGHMKDKAYSKLLESVRNLRRQGKKVIFAGTSLNLAGDNTLTVREFDRVVADFTDKIDAIVVHPNYKNLKKLRYSTSCSVVSFINKKPILKRIGCSSIFTLKKYIPDLEISSQVASTRKH